VNIATGETEFNETYAEHQEDVQEFLRWCREEDDEGLCGTAEVESAEELVEEGAGSRQCAPQCSAHPSAIRSRLSCTPSPTNTSVRRSNTAVLSFKPSRLLIFCASTPPTTSVSRRRCR